MQEKLHEMLSVWFLRGSTAGDHKRKIKSLIKVKDVTQAVLQGWAELWSQGSQIKSVFHEEREGLQKEWGRIGQ